VDVAFAHDPVIGSAVGHTLTRDVVANTGEHEIKRLERPVRLFGEGRALMDETVLSAPQHVIAQLREEEVAAGHDHRDQQARHDRDRDPWVVAKAYPAGLFRQFRRLGCPAGSAGTQRRRAIPDQSERDDPAGGAQR